MKPSLGLLALCYCCLSAKLVTAQLPFEVGFSTVAGGEWSWYRRTVPSEDVVERDVWLMPTGGMGFYIATHPYEGFGVRAFSELGLQGWPHRDQGRRFAERDYPNYARLGVEILRTAGKWQSVGAGLSLTRSRSYSRGDGQAFDETTLRKYASFSTFIEQHLSYITLRIALTGNLHPDRYEASEQRYKEWRMGMQLQLLVPFTRGDWLKRLDREVIIFSPRT